MRERRPRKPANSQPSPYLISCNAIAYHTKHNEDVTGTKECIVVLEFFQTRANLHGGKNKTEEDEYNKDPREVSLEEDYVAVVSISFQNMLADIPITCLLSSFPFTEN